MIETSAQAWTPALGKFEWWINMNKPLLGKATKEWTFETTHEVPGSWGSDEPSAKV